MDLDVMILDVEAAIHRYYLSETAVRVKIEGEETEFNQVNIDKLEAYLARLKARKAQRPDYGAVGMIF